MKACEPDARVMFERRYSEWRRRMDDAGAAAAYPYAWRLPASARLLGAREFARAQLALAQTFFTLGRFAEARAAIPEAGDLPADDAPRVRGLGARCAVLLGSQTVALPRPYTLAEHLESAHLALLSDHPESILACMPMYQLAAAGDEKETVWSEVFSIWAMARTSQCFTQERAQAALARLRLLTAAGTAHAEAILAEAAFHHAPAWSLVWLDAALDQCARYAQHHVEANLLWCKARALEAAGRISEAERFQALAASLARRQGCVFRVTNVPAVIRP